MKEDTDTTLTGILVEDSGLAHLRRVKKSSGRIYRVVEEVKEGDNYKTTEVNGKKIHYTEEVKYD